MNVAHASLATLNFDRLVPIDVAVTRLGTDDAVLRRRCREQWAVQGLAFNVVGPDGGQAKWFVDRSADPRLGTPADRDRHTFPDLSAFTAKQRDGAERRRQCVEWLRAGRRDPAAGDTAAVVARVVERAARDFGGWGVSRTQLYDWDRRYRYPCDLAELVDRRGGDQRSVSSPEAWAMFRDLYLHENQPSVRQCWKEVKRAAAANGWAWCEYSTCHGQLNDRVPPDQQAMHRTPATWRQQASPFTEQNPESWAAGELWVGDHKQLDVVCHWRAGHVRPWLTTWMDWRTRKVVGYVLSDCPNSTTVLAALRHGVMAADNMGPPAHVWIDNGKDYDAWMFHGQTKAERRSAVHAKVDEPRAAGLLGRLGIQAHFAVPYCPNGKARLERWFRTLEAVCKTFETYTGDGVDTTPERLNGVLAFPGKVPTFAAVESRVAAHIAGYNAGTEHTRADLTDDDGRPVSPADAYARGCPTRRVLADPHALDLLMQHWHRPVTVGRNGITLAVKGQPVHYGQFDLALTPFKALRKADRRPVNVTFHPHDLGTIRVYDEQLRFVCTAAMNQVGGRGTGITQETVAETARQKARHKRALKHVAEYGLTATLTHEEHLAATAAEQREQGRTPPPPGDDDPPSLRIVRTPLDGQAADVGREERRMAVGSESVPFPPVKRSLGSLDRLRENLERQARRRDDDDIVPLSPDPIAKLRERNHEW